MKASRLSTLGKAQAGWADKWRVMFNHLEDKEGGIDQ
jgi:hypothetical protein